MLNWPSSCLGKGLDKPYFDKNGVIWLKAGADKRRVNSKEELRRLFQMTDQFHADELPTRAGLDALDELRFRDFLRDTYDQQLPTRPAERLRLLANLNLATKDGVLIRLFMFDDRIEIISPGTLPNNLTVENIRAGNSNLRNPILASFVAKGGQGDGPQPKRVPSTGPSTAGSKSRQPPGRVEQHLSTILTASLPAGTPPRARRRPRPPSPPLRAALGALCRTPIPVSPDSPLVASGAFLAPT